MGGSGIEPGAQAAMEAEHGFAGRIAVLLVGQLPAIGQGALGIETRVDNGRAIVSRVPRDTPAFEAGLNVDDEIIAIGDFRVRADQITQRLDNYRPGDKVSVLVARRERLQRIDLTFGEEPKRWQLELRPEATEAQKQHLEKWVAR